MRSPPHRLSIKYGEPQREQDQWVSNLNRESDGLRRKRSGIQRRKLMRLVRLANQCRRRTKVRATYS